jgi:hypothetical protein
MIVVHSVKPVYNVKDDKFGNYQQGQGIILDDFNNVKEYTDYVQAKQNVHLVTPEMEEYKHVTEVNKQLGNTVIGWLHPSGRISLELVKEQI